MTEGTDVKRPETTVLVIDDTESNRVLAKATLEDEGYRVLLAQDGAAGVEAFDRERPHCVIVDVRMPKMDGFTVCRVIRERPEGKDVPVLFFTALRDVDTFDAAMRAGGDDFLTKPVSPAELLVRVNAAIELRALRTEVRGHFELLRKQRDDLMRLQLQKERLMSFVVHDLKSPLNAMDLHAQLLLRERDLAPTARESATQIRTEARHLHRMVMNLLDLAKADEGQLAAQRTSIELAALLRELTDELDVAARGRQVSIEPDLRTDTAHADPMLLRRALANLVDNAMRHAPPQSAVRVTAERTEGGVKFAIADTGKGVPESMRERIFEAFVQNEEGGRVSAGGGHGLGLTFCKRVAEAHGGRIWVEDASPGAVFCLLIADADE